jgi:transcriptional regulator with XRE-family HTH domain
MTGDLRGETSNAILAAARAGRVGEVVRLSRRAQGLTQQELSARCSVSQPTVSRIERSNDVRDIKTLRIVTRELDIPGALVGLADPLTGGVNSLPNRESSVKRREFLEAAATVVASAMIPGESDQSLAAIRSITAAQRLLDGDTPSRDLSDAVTAHLRLATRKHAAAWDPNARGMIATGISEIAGFAAWLHWDMHDLGSARSYYANAIKAASATDNDTLSAYMLGSLATLSVYEGNAVEGIAILRRAAAQLDPDCPAIAVAWLSSLEGIAQADAKNERATWDALERADEAVRTLASDGPVPWPWVFKFDHEKVARHRLTCAVRLNRPQIALSAAEDVTGFLRAGHAKQRGLLQLDVAEAHSQSGDLEEAIRVAIEAVDLGGRVRSGRIVDRARRFRRHFKGSPAPSIIRDFDDRLQAAQF